MSHHDELLGSSGTSGRAGAGRSSCAASPCWLARPSSPCSPPRSASSSSASAPRPSSSFRVATYVVLVALGWFFFVRPLGRRVSDQQVALYLEEHEPSLQEMLLSAVDAGSPGAAHRADGRVGRPARQLVKSAVERCQASDLGRGLERASLRRSLVALGVIVAVGDARLHARAGLPAAGRVRGAGAGDRRRSGQPVPHRRDARAARPSPRGADVSIAARLSGFTATEVDLFTRARPAARRSSACR